ncbi:hypothetical protein OF83DRAFT_1168434 [Amylostereum chailletii]|nr:hypothetical protein OF83DRAFT_1168434 [Amylostereum chailletii]
MPGPRCLTSKPTTPLALDAVPPKPVQATASVPRIMGSMRADYLGMVLPPVRNARKPSMPQYHTAVEPLDAAPTWTASGSVVSNGPRSAPVIGERDDSGGSSGRARQQGTHGSATHLRPSRSYTPRRPRTQEEPTCLHGLPQTPTLGLFPPEDSADRVVRTVPARRRTTSHELPPTYSILFDGAGRPHTAPIRRPQLASPFVARWVQDQAGPSGALGPRIDAASPSSPSPNSSQDGPDDGDAKVKNGGWMAKVKAKLKPKKSARKLKPGRA